MMSLVVLGILLFLLVSCGTNGRKENSYSDNTQNHLTIVDKEDGRNIAFTKDGNIILYTNDSVGNFIVYYAKFDDNIGKHGYDHVKERTVRMEMDSSLNTVKSIISAYGGAFCENNIDRENHIFYYDEQMNGNRIEQVAAFCEPVSSECSEEEYEIGRIVLLLNSAYKIAFTVNEQNAEGWHNIVEALEPSLDIPINDIIRCDTVYDTIVKNHICRIYSTTEGLTLHYYMLREMMNAE